MRSNEFRFFVLFEGIFVLFLSIPYSAGQAFDLFGKPIDPLTYSSGKPVILIFVRSDCPISNRYAPKIEQLSERYGAKATFWMIYPDKDESAASIRNHLQEYAYKIPALRDPEHVLVKLSQVKVTPEAAVFNAKGELIYHGRIDNWYDSISRSRSVATSHELADGIEAALHGTPLAAKTASPVGCYISDLQ